MAGHVVLTWKRMPRIHDDFLNAVVFLYPTVESAAAGAATGGTGVIVALETSPKSAKGLLFVVTNSHVVREGKSPVVRINQISGKADVIPLTADSWMHHPDGDDVAAAPVGLLAAHRFASVPLELFVTPEGMEKYNFGLGDECFFAGRFVEREGIEQNLPTLRFGNLARLAVEPITHPTRGIEQESFLVEARSLSGYSGSPVFVYQTAVVTAQDTRMRAWDHSPVFLLGIDWCHLPIHKPVLEADRETLVSEDLWVETNSGMMGVVPAWKIAELMTGEEVGELMEDYMNSHASSPSPVSTRQPTRGTSALCPRRSARSAPTRSDCSPTLAP